jgi:hypothetical protein
VWLAAGAAVIHYACPLPAESPPSAG